MLKYVTRATYHGENQKVRDIIHGFRNNRVFGFTKQNTPILSNEFIAKIEAMDEDLIIIPEKDSIVWEKKPIKIKDLREKILTENEELKAFVSDTLRKNGKHVTFKDLLKCDGYVYIGAGLFTNRRNDKIFDDF
jgi:hypothetical protein